MPKLLFASYHCLIDPSSGAALATRDLLELLSERGWDCRVLCGPHLDFGAAESLPQLLGDQHIPFERRESSEGPLPFSVVHFRQQAVPMAVYQPSQSRRAVPSRAEGGPFLALLERMLERVRPDVLLTYGGQWLAQEMMSRARRRGVPVVFALHNFAYQNVRFFRSVDRVLVPSEFCRRWYKQRLGLECTAIPSPVNWSRVLCERAADARYVTFVNPQPSKGVFVFARIALELGRRRPDIPLLIVEGRAKAADWLKHIGPDLGGLSNLHRMANTPHPRDFYRVSRLVLMPSLCNESFGRVAAEALVNGIPVLASRRGALPEVLREAGLLFEIPPRYTPETRLLPSAAEVERWIEAIVRLWDDAALYEQEVRRCRAAAEARRPERIGDLHDAFFRALVRRTA